MRAERGQITSVTSEKLLSPVFSSRADRSCSLGWDPCVEKRRVGMNLHQSCREGVRHRLEQQFITNSRRLSKSDAETERKVWGCRDNIQLVKVPPSPYIRQPYTMEDF